MLLSAKDMQDVITESARLARELQLVYARAWQLMNGVPDSPVPVEVSVFAFVRELAERGSPPDDDSEDDSDEDPFGDDEEVTE